MATDQSYLWTSECVGEGHPDKVADQISDAVLDACLEQDPKSRVACETLVKDDHVVLAGEITTNATVSFDHIVSNALSSIGYDYEPKVLNLLSQQSNEISQAVGDFDGAGDQGIMFGYATSETPTYMPLTMYLARDVSNMLTSNRLAATEIGKFLLPDCKTQVSVRFNGDGTPQFIERVVVSTNHKKGITLDELRYGIKSMFKLWSSRPAASLRIMNLFTSDTVFDINPAGIWLFGGPRADCGLTGRKIIVDAYGADCQWGGGALSGKDPTKVDRSAAYMARYIAKNIVAAEYANKATVQLSYAIGRSEPTSFRVMTDKPENDRMIENKVLGALSLKPRDIIIKLDLLKPIYQSTARDGHFGNDIYSWEQLDLTF